MNADAMDSQNILKNLEDLARDCKRDPGLSKELEKDALGVLKRYNAILPSPNVSDNVTVKVSRNTDKVMYIPIPQFSEFGQVSDNIMNRVAGGTTGFVSTVSTAVSCAGSFSTV